MFLQLVNFEELRLEGLIELGCAMVQHLLGLLVLLELDLEAVHFIFFLLDQFLGRFLIFKQVVLLIFKL